MLQLILGRTGTGKSTAVLDRAIAAAGQGVRTILLVPEQFSFEAERAAADRLRGRAALGLSVLSFSRLSENIFRAWGGLARKRLTDVARVVLMRLAVGEMQDTLAVYQSQVGKPQFLTTMLQTVEELKQAGTTPQQLADLTGSVEDPQLRLKLGDIAGIFGAYQALVDRSYDDPLDDIVRAAGLAVEHRFFAGCQVFVDGFGFFSPPEREMLYAAMEQADALTVALCADGLALREGVDIFADQKHTAQRLLNYARGHQVTVGAPLVLTENRRTHRPALLVVEELAVGEDIPEENVPEDGLVLPEAATAYDELCYVAGEIARLVREEGCRYRDIAILCRRLDDYRALLRAVVEDGGIPLFMDRKESILTRPMAQFVTAALDAACGNFRTESMLKLVRSPAVGIPLQDAAALENYVYIWSVAGEGWREPFRNNPAGLGDEPPEGYRDRLVPIEAARHRVVEPLERLRDDLRGCDGPGFSAALYRYVRAAKALEHLREAFGRDGGSDAAGENDRIWNSVVDILDIFSETLAGAGQSPRELASLFGLALSQTQLGNIPATNDQVIAGSADTVRLASPRVTFVLGVNEGVFPARVGFQGVFTDLERTELIRQGLEISSPALQRAVQERFFLYTALCSPRERLYVSHIRTDESGAPAQPSLLLSILGDRFPAARVEVDRLSPYELIHDLGSARLGYARLASQGGPEAATLAALLRRRGEHRFLEAVRAAGDDLPMEDILPGTSRRLLGEHLVLSPSRIETFYGCPYNFFCNYMLGLSPRRRVAYSPLESGNAIHHVLELLLREVGDRGLGSLSDDELREKIDGYLTAYIQAMAEDTATLAARFRYQFRRLSFLLFTIIRHIGREFDQSMFRAVGMEVTVGGDGQVRPAQLRLEDGTVVELVGKIDRVDLYEDDTGRYVRVVDYKSGGKDFRLSDVMFGLNMQMLLYLFAVCDDTVQAFGAVQPAGVLYLNGNLSPAEAAPGEEDARAVAARLEKSMRMKGVVLDDEQILRAMERELEGRFIPAQLKKDQTLSSTSKTLSRQGFLELRKQVYGQVTAMAEEIRAGRVAPNPVRGKSVRTPCEYCQYARLCNDRDGKVFRPVDAAEEGGEDDG